MRAKKIVNQSSDFPVRRTGSYRHKKAVIIIVMQRLTRHESVIVFAYPDIRYPDIWIYPLILWQPKIRIS